VEEAETAEIRSGDRESPRAVEYGVDLSAARRSIRRNAVTRPPAAVGHDCNAALRHFAIRPLRGDIWTNREQEMNVVAHDREGNDINRHPVREKLETVEDPRPACGIVKERFPAHASRDAVIDAGVAGVDDVASSLCHGANLRCNSSGSPSAAFLSRR
jgi:hypothetical protein